jgi:hypothetical protein
MQRQIPARGVHEPHHVLREYLPKSPQPHFAPGPGRGPPPPPPSSPAGLGTRLQLALVLLHLALLAAAGAQLWRDEGTVQGRAGQGGVWGEGVLQTGRCTAPGGWADMLVQPASRLLL